MNCLSRRESSATLSRVPNARSRTPARALLTVVALIGSSSVLATGFPPFPRTDSMTVSRGGAVSVLDSGATSVLANDLDFEGDPLTAFLDEDVSNGTLTLNPNGTFLYVHNGMGMGMGGGSDRFRYRAFDGLRFSRRTDVNITIIDDDPGPPIISGQRNITTNEDQPRLITRQDLFIEGGGGNLQLWVGPGENYTVSGVTIVPAMNFNGTLNPPVRVSDGNVDSNSFILDVTVRPVNDPPLVVGSVPDQTAQEGELFRLQLAPLFSEIDLGDSLIFTATGLPPSRSLLLDRNTGVLSGTPQLADAQALPFDVTITAEDDERETASLAFRLTISARNRADLELSLSVQPNPAIFLNTPLWNINVENLGPSMMDQGTLTAEWFSSEGPISLSVTGAGCTLTGNDTVQPEVTCQLSGLPASSSSSVLVQSTHQVPGDTHLTAWVTADDPQPQNNIAALSLNLAASFGEGPAQNLAASASDVATGDLNGDGHIDLVVAAQNLEVYFNTGQRSLETQGVRLGAGGAGSSVELIDWNMDGASDVAIAHADGRVGELHINNGDGSFSQIVQLPVTGVATMTRVDLNGDGQFELVVSGPGGTEGIRNDGQGRPLIALISPIIARDVSAGDLDIDGLSDLILTEAQSRAIHLLMNDGDGSSFSESMLQTGSVASVNANDVDGDGAPDLLVAIDGADLEVPVSRVLRNQLDGSFTDWALVGASPTTELYSGDVSGDGIIDLITINETGVHQIYLGDNLGGFTLDEQHILSLSTVRGHLVDINNDTSLDLILAGITADNVAVHANNGLGRFGLGDRTAPVISLNGARTIVIDAGDIYVDPGATATDDVDGDITANIVVNNPVDGKVIGSYTVSYAVTDRAGNAEQATRSVQVGVVAEGGGGGGAPGRLLLAFLAGLLALRRRYFRKG